jgi:hypothetical protein
LCSDLGKAQTEFGVTGRDTRDLLAATDREIDIARVELDQPRAAPGALRRRVVLTIRTSTLLRALSQLPVADARESRAVAVSGTEVESGLRQRGYPR